MLQLLPQQTYNCKRIVVSSLNDSPHQYEFEGDSPTSGSQQQLRILLSGTAK